MKYRSVVFDMDGVLLDFRGDNFSWKYDSVREGLRELGADPSGMSQEELETLLGTFGEERFKKKIEELSLEPRKTWEMMAAKTSEARIEMIDRDQFSLFDDAFDTVKWLRSEGVRTGIISNAPGPGVEATVDHFDLKRLVKFYRGVETWSDFHHRKPDPRMLELARAELKHGPFLYVGDHESDVQAARNANMDSAWVNRNGNSLETDHEYEMETLAKIREIVSE